ncbi:MAG: polyamine aminopropyltransferase [Gammaproteobacteria bacterium]|nr:polyamine aminopropyltransferase [Gammaproteobacteria bacterium]
MALDKNWFVEVAPEAGFAQALKIRGKLHEEQTPYQKLEIFETEDWGNLMTLDGLVMLTARDNFVYHEMMSHPPVMTHPAPRRVAIVGGGDCGTLREVLRHPAIEKVFQIEIDEAVTRAAERYFPELTEANDDPRAELLFSDAIEWMKRQEPGSLDVVIVDSTDPVGPAVGLFQRAFYADCLRALGKTGVLVQQSESPLLHLDILKAMRAEMKAAGFEQLRTYQFCQPTYPSGWWSATMAGIGVDLTEFRERDARKLPFNGRYYSADMHRSSMVMPPFFEKACSEHERK